MRNNSIVGPAQLEVHQLNTPVLKGQSVGRGQAGSCQMEKRIVGNWVRVEAWEAPTTPSTNNLDQSVTQHLNTFQNVLIQSHLKDSHYTHL